MPRTITRRTTVLAFGLMAVPAGVAAAQDGRAAPSELHVSRIKTASYITTADVSNPNGVNPNLSPTPSSGNPIGYNDPTLGFNSARYRAKTPQYSGVTQLIMTYQTTNLTTGAIGSAGFICSGALINGGYSVLTAGHCVVNSISGGIQYTLQNVQVRLGQNFGGNTTGEPGAGAPNINQSFSFARTMGADAVAINPGYTGSVIDERDIAIINLGTSAPHTFAWYDLFTQSAIDQSYNIAGWGGRGNGNLGTVARGTAGARLRQGLNVFDVSYADPRWTPAFGALVFGSRTPQDVYLSDFDNGLAANNALCRLTSFATINGEFIWSDRAHLLCDPGLGLDEVSSAGGDSGGPSFVNGKIAAVTSFGQSFGRNFGDIDGALDSSFGELNGMTRVDINARWVQAAVTTPEPTTIVLLGGGLLGLVAVARRRRTS